MILLMILIEGNKFSIGKVLQKKLMLFMLGLIYVVLWWKQKRPEDSIHGT